MITLIPTSIFNYKNKTFVAEASSLKQYTWNSNITLVNPKTKGKVTFDLAQVKRDRDNDVQFWRFAARPGSYSNLNIIIFND